MYSVKYMDILLVFKRCIFFSIRIQNEYIQSTAQVHQYEVHPQYTYIHTTTIHRHTHHNYSKTVHNPTIHASTRTGRHTDDPTNPATYAHLLKIVWRLAHEITIFQITQGLLTTTLTLLHTVKKIKHPYFAHIFFTYMTCIFHSIIILCTQLAYLHIIVKDMRMFTLSTYILALK